MPKPRLLHRIATIFFLLAGIAYAVPTLTFRHFSAIELVVLLCCLLPVVINKPWLHKVFGSIAISAVLVMFFALVSDCIDYISGQQIHSPITYFGIGFLLAFCCMVFGAVLVFVNAPKIIAETNS